jgi:hypothetical protein
MINQQVRHAVRWSNGSLVDAPMKRWPMKRWPMERRPMERRPMERKSAARAPPEQA